MWKAICTDIDGTLLNAERKLSERTISAFQKVKHNTAIILASSRMPAAMQHLQKTIGIEKHPLICYNGGYIIDQRDGIRCLSSVTIPFNWVQVITEWSINNKLHASLYFEDSWFAPDDDYWTKRESNNTQVIPTIRANQLVLDEWGQTDNGAHKIMLMGDEKKIDEVIEYLHQLEAPLHLYRSKDTYLEIAPREISKATALELLIKDQFQFSLSEIIAFGDNYNDIDMLTAVGKGVAVGNAKPEVLVVADEHTQPSKEDGVAICIEKYFKS